MYEVTFDWFDESSWKNEIPTDLGIRHETLRISRSKTSVEEIYALIKRTYNSPRNIKIKIVKDRV